MVSRPVGARLGCSGGGTRSAFWNRESELEVYASVGAAKSRQAEPGNGRHPLERAQGRGVRALVRPRRTSWLAVSVTALLVVVLPLPPAGPAAWASPPTTPGSCTVAGFDQAAGKAAADGFSQVDCSKGWGLAAGRSGAAGGVGIFQRLRQGWAEVGLIVPQSLRAIPPPFARLGISPALLVQLARPFPPSVRQLVGAGALVEELLVREAGLKAQGAYQVSPVATVNHVAWFALAGTESSGVSSPSPTGQPYPDGTLWVYRWSATGWAEQSAVKGWMGPIVGGCCGIAAVSLTGPSDPDFAITGEARRTPTGSPSCPMPAGAGTWSPSTTATR
jgi:hypothetical protein